MAIAVEGATMFAFGGALTATFLDLWIGLRSTRGTWRDVWQIRRDQGALSKRPDSGPVGETITSALMGVVALDLIACTLIIIAIIVFQPSNVSEAFLGGSSWVAWFGSGLAAPFLSGRALVGKTVARLFGQVYALPPSGQEQWIADPWRVRYRVRVDFLDHVFPMADERLTRTDNAFRSLETQLARGELPAEAVRASLVRYKTQRERTMPKELCEHLDGAAAGVWREMSDPERIHWAQVAVFLCVNLGVTTPLRRYVVP